MYNVNDKQCFFDVAIHEHGNIEAAFAMAAENGYALTDYLEAGTELRVPEAEKSADVIEIYTARRIIPATDFTENETGQLMAEGISYWAIGVDFVVQ